MGTLFVNKSGRAFKITRTNGGSDVIGTLPVNAIFAWTDSWAGNGAGADYQVIYCNGMYGWIDGATGTGAFTPLTECGLYNVDVDGDGTVEAVFQTRRAAKYYDKTGKYLLPIYTLELYRKAILLLLPATLPVSLIQT